VRATEVSPAATRKSAKKARLKAPRLSGASSPNRETPITASAGGSQQALRQRFTPNEGIRRPSGSMWGGRVGWGVLVLLILPTHAIMVFRSLLLSLVVGVSAAVSVTTEAR
jgi:hypothetical protein